MNLADPELELIDPTPNVHNLFIHFDKEFFWAKLASRAVVRWSKRMYSCAGICSYEGRGGLCDIALSEPLLKLRPRKNLVETLLHEMIHAFLFITNRDRDRDGHGPNFQAHMHRINKTAGLNISIYHDFHEEVELYQTHWWRCNGPCQTRRPHFGIVRRAMNRPPGPYDYWWKSHLANCGGTFTKIKEPEQQVKPTKAKPKQNNQITNYINKKTEVPRPVLKDSNVIPVKTKSNGSSTVIISKKEPGFNPQPITQVNKPIQVFSGKGQSLTNNRPRSNSVGVVDVVRNVWANKKLPLNNTVLNPIEMKTKLLNKTVTLTQTTKASKHKSDTKLTSPPTKINKIDDYFKKAASTTLKDLYGQDFQITQSKEDKKIVAVPIKIEDKNDTFEIKTEECTVACPVCSNRINDKDINRHLDECLNKDVIENLCKEVSTVPSQDDKSNLREIVGVIPVIPNFKRPEVASTSNNRMNGQIDEIQNKNHIYKEVIKLESDIKEEYHSDDNHLNKLKEIVTVINHEKDLQKSGNYVPPKQIYKPYSGVMPLFLDDMAVKIKTEPGTSKDMTVDQKCACCGDVVDKPLEEHLDECLAFVSSDTSKPEEGTSTSLNEPIVIDDDDDIFDESQTMNATGTKYPCPCCLKMIEEDEMNAHLDSCLG